MSVKLRWIVVPILALIPALIAGCTNNFGEFTFDPNSSNEGGSGNSAGKGGAAGSEDGGGTGGGVSGGSGGADSGAGGVDGGVDAEDAGDAGDAEGGTNEGGTAGDGGAGGTAGDGGAGGTAGDGGVGGTGGDGGGGGTAGDGGTGGTGGGPTCVAPETLCGSECANLGNSSKHCAVCGNECPGTPTLQASFLCSGTVCVCNGEESCRVNGFTDGTVSCVTTGGSVGLCRCRGSNCRPGEFCRGGGSGGTTPTCTCDGITSCSQSEVCSNGVCVDTTTNPNHCGALGNVCSGATSTCCNSTCVDVGSDRSNCGGCGNVCRGTSGTPSTQADFACVGGVCQCDGDLSCSEAGVIGGIMECVPSGPAEGICYCGTGPCRRGEYCRNGGGANRVCSCGATTTCTSAQTCCGTMCVNTNSNVNHCGSCGKSCASGQICCVGECVTGGTNEHCSNGSGAIGCEPCATGESCIDSPGFYSCG